MNRLYHRTAALVLSLCLLASAFSAPGSAQAADSHGKAKRTVVYHIDDSSRAIPMIRNIGNHRNADADIRIVVVAVGKGIDFLLDGAMDDRGNSYDALVDTLMLRGVEFEVCRNSMEARKFTNDQLLPDVKVVPSGVAEIARLQIDQGAAYIKP